MLGTGYDADENYKMIRDTGRRPVICTRKNHAIRGFGPRATDAPMVEEEEESRRV